MLLDKSTKKRSVAQKLSKDDTPSRVTRTATQPNLKASFMVNRNDCIMDSDSQSTEERWEQL